MHQVTISLIVVAGIFTTIYFVYFQNGQDQPPSIAEERTPLITQDYMYQAPMTEEENDDEAEWDMV